MNNRALEITIEDYCEKKKKGEKVKLIDVRTLEEHKEYHIEDTDALIPLNVLQLRMANGNTSGLDKDELIVIYCRSGRRSAMAAKLLEDNGFTNVKSLVGGAEKWKELESNHTLSQEQPIPTKRM